MRGDFGESIRQRGQPAMDIVLSRYPATLKLAFMALAVSVIMSTILGVISAVNALLDSNPETVNADPYGDGWLFELEMEEGADLEDLLDADAYAEQVGS